MFEKVDCFVGRFFVSILLKGVADKFEWVLLDRFIWGCKVCLMTVLGQECNVGGT